MNPFDLRGPEFLLFYLVLALGALGVIIALRRARESERIFGDPRLTDPYVIAYLRGGGPAAIEAAVVSLVDRKLLDAGADGITSRRGLRAAQFVDPLERSIIEESATALTAKKLAARKFEGVFANYEHTLSRLGLVPDESEKSARLRDSLAAIFLLVGVAGIKIIVALSRGRTNVAFLIILAIVSVIGLLALGNPRLTRRGKNVLEDLRTLFQGLKSRADSLSPGNAAAELALVAALFGTVALPIGAFPMRDQLFPPPSSSSDSGGSGSSCGSSCGGGGCGGGCGGCGS